MLSYSGAATTYIWYYMFVFIRGGFLYYTHRYPYILICRYRHQQPRCTAQPCVCACDLKRYIIQTANKKNKTRTKRTFFECALEDGRYCIKFLQTQSKLYVYITSSAHKYLPTYMYMLRVIVTCGQCVYMYNTNNWVMVRAISRRPRLYVYYTYILGTRVTILL